MRRPGRWNRGGSLSQRKESCMLYLFPELWYDPLGKAPGGGTDPPGSRRPAEKTFISLTGSVAVDIAILLALQEFRNGIGSCLADFMSKMTFLG